MSTGGTYYVSSKTYQAGVLKNSKTKIILTKLRKQDDEDIW